MLAAFATFTTELALVGLIGWLYLAPPEGEWRQLVEAAFAVLAMASVVLGLLTLVLTAVASHLRDEPPPISIVRVAIAVGIIPPVVWLLLLFVPR